MKFHSARLQSSAFPRTPPHARHAQALSGIQSTAFHLRHIRKVNSSIAHQPSRSQSKPSSAFRAPSTSRIEKARHSSLPASSAGVGSCPCFTRRRSQVGIRYRHSWNNAQADYGLWYNREQDANNAGQRNFAIQSICSITARQ